VVGDVVVVPESQIDALSTISGSGPAYVFYLIEQLQEAAVALGFTRAQAATMVQGTFRGASELLATSDVLPADAAPAELRRRVTSPGGTTERAVAELADGGVLDLFERATQAALARNREIAEGR
jgi:pyrroline-5-carboxylate reductase